MHILSRLLSRLARVRTRPRLGLGAGTGLAVLVALAAQPAAAQGGHFTAGDLFVDSSSIFPAADGSAIMRVDPVTHATSVFVDTTSTSAQSCFDTYRQRLIFTGSTDPAHPYNIWMADGLGNLQALGPLAIYAHFAPTGDGRIYMTNGNLACCEPYAWIDAANVVHTLLDSTGLNPYRVDGLPGIDVRGMVYDPTSNSLIWSAVNVPCGPNSHANIRRASLSADGSRVIGTTDCASFEVINPMFVDGSVPRNLARMPDGRILFFTSSSGNAPNTNNFPRILQVDPLTLAISPFAFTGNYVSANVVDTGTWSETLNKAVVLDTFLDDLRDWSEGEVGPGTAIAPIGGGVSSVGGGAEGVNMLSIPSSPCKGGWLPYGTGLAGKGGFVPTLIGGNCPMAGSGITLNVANAVGGAGGALFVGLAGVSLPFKGGTLYVAPISLTVNIVLGGAPGTAGAGSASLPVTVPMGLSGVSLFLQGAFGDTAAVHKVSLTQGLQMEIG